MGIVYKAKQLSANCCVAVKLIAAGDLATPELVRRFRSEAETGRRLMGPLRHSAAVRSAQFAARDRLLVSVDTENSVWLWDASSGAPVGEIG